MIHRITFLPPKKEKVRNALKNGASLICTVQDKKNTTKTLTYLRETPLGELFGLITLDDNGVEGNTWGAFDIEYSGLYSQLEFIAKKKSTVYEIWIGYPNIPMITHQSSLEDVYLALNAGLTLSSVQSDSNVYLQMIDGSIQHIWRSISYRSYETYKYVEYNDIKITRKYDLIGLQNAWEHFIFCAGDNKIVITD